MISQLKYLRLFIILLALAAVILLQMRAQLQAEYWRKSTYHQWAADVWWHETTSSIRLTRKLISPLKAYDKEIKSFIKPQLDTAGFISWLKTKSASDSLIGAGFIWQKDLDSLTVIPLLMHLDPITAGEIKQVFDWENDPRYFKIQRIHSMNVTIDSLREVINRKYGWTDYEYDFYDEFPTRRQRAQARQTVIGVIWNHDYYRGHHLPLMLSEVRQDPFIYGILSTFRDSTERPGPHSIRNGFLLVDGKNDTLAHLGYVNLDDYQTLKKFNSRFHKEGFTLSRTPWWKLYYQDHHPDIYELEQSSWLMAGDDNVAGGTSWIDSRLIGEENLPEFRQALGTMLNSLIKPASSAKTAQWLVLGGALGLLFLMLLLQILARNRQRTFIAQISHELRTPVTRLKLSAETLLYDRSLTAEKEKENLQSLVAESDRLSTLVDNTLNLARWESSGLKIQPRSVDLNQWIVDINDRLSGLVETNSARLNIQVEAALPSIKGDPEALELVLRNLLDNAVKYSKPPAEVDILITKTHREKIQIKVLDRGVGIPKSRQRKVFKRFYRISPTGLEPVSGVGLGLSLAREIALAHRGRIWCETREGGGSMFVIELPSEKS